MLKKIRRFFFTWSDFHHDKFVGCYRHFFLFGHEALRMSLSCSHQGFIDMRLKKLVIELKG